MNKRFRDKIEQMKVLFDELNKSLYLPSREATQSRDVPSSPGIYVFFEDDSPLYVGRTNNIKHRIRIHRMSNAMGSSFAYKLAMLEATNLGIDMSPYKDKTARLAHEPFLRLFEVSKARIGDMHVRFVKVEDPITQALFEMYVHLEFDTPHNDFDNH